MANKIITCGFKANGGVVNSFKNVKNIEHIGSFMTLKELIDEYSVRPIYCDRILFTSNVFSDLIEDCTTIKDFYMSRLADKGISVVVMSKDRDFTFFFNNMFLEEDNIVCCWFDALTVLMLDELLTAYPEELSKKYKLKQDNNAVNDESVLEQLSNLDDNPEDNETELDTPSDDIFEGNEENEEGIKDDFNIDLALDLDLLSDIEDATQDEETDLNSLLAELETNEGDETEVEDIGDITPEDDGVVKADNNLENFEDITDFRENDEFNAVTSDTNYKELEPTIEDISDEIFEDKSDIEEKEDIATESEKKFEGAKIYRLFPSLDDSDSDSSTLYSKTALDTDEHNKKEDYTKDEQPKLKKSVGLFKKASNRAYSGDDINSIHAFEKYFNGLSFPRSRNIYIVTGREGSGVTTVGMLLGYLYNTIAKENVLYVDFDFRGNDTWDRFGIYNRFNDLNEQGLYSLQKSRVEDCKIDIISGYDIVTSNGAVLLDNLDLRAVVSNATAGQYYNHIIFDIPFQFLNLMPDVLFMLANVNIFVAEDTSGGGLKLAHALDGLNIDNKDSFLHRTTIVPNKSTDIKFDIEKFIVTNIDSVIDIYSLNFIKSKIPLINWDYSLGNLIKQDKKVLDAIINMFRELVGV